MSLPFVKHEKISTLKRYSENLKVTLLHNATAYGYSIVITGTYIILANSEGSPTSAQVFLAAFGAVLSFAIVEAVSTHGFRERAKGDKPEVVMLGSAMAFFSVGLSLGAAALSSYYLHGWVDWLLAPLFATTVYVLVETIELMLAKRIKREPEV